MMIVVMMVMTGKMVVMNVHRAGPPFFLFI